jgi:AcrR family transcriptional regulator
MRGNVARAPIDRIEQRKLTRAKLVDAALQLFSTSGYEHATVDDISHEAGYSKGAYYFHFSTKDDILLELLRIWTEGRSASLVRDEAASISPDELRQTLAGFFSYAEAPRWPGVLLEFWAQAVRNPEVSKRLTQAYAGWRKEIAGAFDAAARGGLRVESAEDAASVVLAAHDGFAVQTAIGAPGGGGMSAADLADSIVAPMETAAEAAERRTIAM